MIRESHHTSQWLPYFSSSHQWNDSDKVSQRLFRLIFVCFLLWLYSCGVSIKPKENNANRSFRWKDLSTDEQSVCAYKEEMTRLGLRLYSFWSSWTHPTPVPINRISIEKEKIKRNSRTGVSLNRCPLWICLLIPLKSYHVFYYQPIFVSVAR